MRGFHIYKEVWEPTEELLTCSREPSNVHDPYAVSMKTRENVIVGHVPKVISSLCNIFIAQGGTLECRVTGHKRYSVDLPQGGLELPCELYFTSSSCEQLEKVKVLLEKCPAHQSVKSNITEPMSKKFKKDEEMESPTYLYVSETSEIWLSDHGYCLTLLDKTKLTNRSMLHDNHINFAQTILKNQFQVAEGLCSSLYQFKPKSVDRKIKHGLQIVHCRGNHWILASNMTNEEGILNIYDSVYSSLDNDTQKVLANLFVFEEVRFVTFQKQVGGTDCGLFAIAAATQILSLNSPTFHFCQDQMRSHAFTCYEMKKFSCFP